MSSLDIERGGYKCISKTNIEVPINDSTSATNDVNLEINACRAENGICEGTGSKRIQEKNPHPGKRRGKGQVKAPKTSERGNTHVLLSEDEWTRQDTERKRVDQGYSLSRERRGAVRKRKESGRTRTLTN